MPRNSPSTSPPRSPTRTARRISATPMRRLRPTHRALPEARRLRRVFPDRHRRARPEDAADRGQGRPDRARNCATATCRASRRWSQTLNCSNDDFIHTTEARHLPRVGGDLAPHGGERRHLSRQICRLVFGARRGLLRRGRNACQRTQSAARHEDGHAGRVGGGGELFLQALGLSGQAPQALRRRAGFRAAEGTAQRSRELRQRRAQGPVDLAHDLRLGHSGARQPTSTSCMSGSTR